MDDRALHIATINGDEQTVPLDHFLELTRFLEPRGAAGKFFLLLQGGDRLFGQPVALVGQQIEWKSPTLGNLRLPLRQVAAFSRVGRPLTNDRPAEDVVSLNNGDAVRGIVTDVSAAKVVVQTEGASTELAVSSVAGVAFAATPGARPVQAGVRVRFDDGGSATGSKLRMDGDALQLSLAGNPSPLKIDLSHLTAIEQVNGPVSWLSSRTPSESVYTPFIGSDQSWPAKMDLSVTGGPLRFGDEVFSHGIGVHAYSRLSWPIDAGWKGFRTRFAIDGDGLESARADVTVRIRLDGRVVFEQPHTRAGVMSRVITQALDGAKVLTLEVDFGDQIDTQARFDWIEPALLKNLPAAPSSEPATAPTEAPANP